MTVPRTSESRIRKLTWSLWGKGERVEQVRRFRDLVQQLHDLVPPDEVLSTAGGSGALTLRLGASPDHSWTTEFRQLLARLDGEIKAETQQKLRSWLLGRHPPNERYDDSIEQRLEGTCNWIFNRAAFLRWASPGFAATKPKLLWINGPAGFGKTILCARVIEHLKSALDTPVIHFFFSSDFESREDPFAAIRSWISQVVSCNQVAFDVVRQRWEIGHDQVATRATVVRLFREILQAAPDCTMIVDGLDECSSTRDISVAVASFLETVKQAVVGTNTRILVVSRDVSEIRQAFTDVTNAEFEEFRISPEDVRADTASYSRSIVDRKLSKKSQDIRNDISLRMADRCEGQFLWLKMQADCLSGGLNRKQLQRAIEETPTGLASLYDRNWVKINRLPERDRLRAFSLLRWTAFALRPLTICEVTEAVLVDHECEDFPIDELPDSIDDEYIETRILELCSSLLEARSQTSGPSAAQQTVHLIHFSVKQYLLCNLPNRGTLRENERLRGSNERNEHTVLAKLCLRYICFGRVWQGPLLEQKNGVGMLFRDYAAASWHHHMRAGVTHDVDMTSLAKTFLNRNNSTWAAWRKWVDSKKEVWKEELSTEKQSPGPLYYAVELELTDVAVGLIEENGYDVNDEGGHGMTTLGVAAAKANVTVLNRLLELGAGVGTTDSNGWTPVCQASLNGHVEVVKLLLENGADITISTNSFTPVNVASFNGHVEVVKLLLENGADVTVAGDDGVTPVNAASGNGHVVVKLLLENGADITVVDNNGWTLFIAASLNGHAEVVKLLLENGADITLANNDEWTPLYSASSKGHVEVVRLLLENGADTTVANNNGWTPVIAASFNGYVEVVKLLLENGADITVANNDGWTPLYAASYSGHVEVVRLLLENGAYMIAANNDRLSPLIAASSNGHAGVVTLLLGIPHVDASKPDNLGRTAFFFASRYGQYQASQVLLSEGRVNPDIRDWMGSTALFAAVANGHLHVAKLLIASGAAVEMQGGVGQSLIWWALRAGNPQLLQLLVEHTEMVGTRIPDDPIPNDVVSTPFDHEADWCDACTLSIQGGCRYSCSVCDRGFCLCVECFARGIRFCDKTHVLMLQ